MYFTAARTFTIACLILAIDVHKTLGAPQFSPYVVQPGIITNELPEPYEYHYKVEYPPTNTFYGKQESGDAAGRVTGSYYVHLPDKRIMTVEYLVNGDSGFVPKVTFSSPGGFPAAGR